MPDLNEVQKYWEENPLFSLEVLGVGTRDFFETLDQIKKNDVERFTIDFWDFNNFQDKKVLDVGCGPGWITVNYALGKADVYSIDLTSKAVELTRRFLALKNATAKVEQGNAENLHFGDNYFDLVVSSGVLHHTPDYRKAFCECLRVLKPGGRAKITLYHKGFLHGSLIFPILKFAMKLINVNRPGANLTRAKDADDFIRQYDGSDNPIGIGKNRHDWVHDLREAGFVIDKVNIHFFPKRFILFNNLMPKFLHYLLDRYFGTMIYFDLHKPAN